MTFDPDATLLKIFTDPETISDPYPLYAELREHAPIFKTELVGRWVFTRFDDAARFSAILGAGAVLA